MHASRAHVEKMIIKSAVAGRVGLGALRAVIKKTKSGERALNGGCARHQTTFDADRVGSESQARGSDARGPIFFRFVADQSVLWICFMQEISECLPLEVVQHSVIGFIARMGGSLVVRHFVFGIPANSYQH